MTVNSLFGFRPRPLPDIVQNKSFQTLGNTVQDRNGTKLDLKNYGQYGLLQQCLSFALPRFTWPF